MKKWIYICKYIKNYVTSCARTVQRCAGVVVSCRFHIGTNSPKVRGSPQMSLPAALHIVSRYTDRLLNLKYYVAEEYWGKGIMTEAVKQICEYVFDKSDIIRIYAEPFAYNIASCRVNSLRKTIER